MALATKAMTQDLGEAYEAMGMIKAFSFIRKIATVAYLKNNSRNQRNQEIQGFELYRQRRTTCDGRKF